MISIGISCFYHDSSACLVENGMVKLAVEEERFTGIKHDSSFPKNSIDWILKENNLSSSKVDEVCFYEKPLLKTHRIVTNCLVNFQIKDSFKFAVKGIQQYFWLKKEIKRRFPNASLKFFTHHDSHIGYSYLTSPFKEAAILTVDGVGEWDTTVLAKGVENSWQEISSVQFPNSLGMFYSTMTAFLGFKPNEGEYKVMGLAPYGNPRTFTYKFRDIIYPSKNGGYKLNMKMFQYDKSDEVMFTSELSNHLGLLPRLPNEELTQEHKDLAASVQFIYEMYFFRLLKELHKKTKTNNLVLGGGCAYNGTANGKISKKTGFKNVWIPSAPSDSGSSIGACLISQQSGYLIRFDNTNPFLGPKFSNEYILQILRTYNNKLIYKKLSDYEIIENVATKISNGEVIAWFEGRLELGARALGHRSIFADARNPEMKNKINKIVKKREGFRPFAPIVKDSATSKYFEWDKEIPYMNQIVMVKKEYRDKLPAITHIDGSARIQTLKENSETNRVYKLLNKLEEKIGYPIVLNTSFNVKDQTMIMNPQTAIETFLNIGLDALVLENYLIQKK